jgi:hypothetical protein
VTARAVVSLLGPTVLGCLLEDHDGEVVAHYVRDVHLPDALVRSVVVRSAAVLDAALVGRRTVGLVRTGPVVRGSLGPLTVLRARLSAGGSLWLLVDGETPALCEIERVLDHVALPVAPAPLLACLEGRGDAPLPDVLRPCSRWWVAAVSGPAPAPSGQLVVQSCSDGDVTYVVAGGGAASRTAQVRSLLAGLRAGVSRARATPSLAEARAEADLALEVAGPDEVVTVDERRSALVVRHVSKALDTLPDLGDDPLARLAAYDARRDGRLVETLRCWLTSRTDVLGVHGNTLRYRLRRIEQITGVDLRHDATGRLELQLRLAAQPQLSRRTTSTAS